MPYIAGLRWWVPIHWRFDNRWMGFGTLKVVVTFDCTAWYVGVAWQIRAERSIGSVSLRLLPLCIRAHWKRYG